VVHSVCTVLAAGVAGIDCVSVCVAPQSAISNYRHHATRSFCSAERDSAAASAPAARAPDDLKQVFERLISFGNNVQVNNTELPVIPDFSTFLRHRTAFAESRASGGNPCGNRGGPVSGKVILGPTAIFRRIQTLL
jgi:hypothetical protein